MRPLIKVLAIIEATALLGAVGIVLSRRLPYKASHAPVSRPPMAAADEKAVERAKSWTVLISNEGFEQKYRGTGMLIDSTHVLTADHMVSTNGNEMWIYISPGRRVVRGKAVFENSRDDLAVLELDEKVELPAYATFQEEHHDGQPIIIIGNILGGMRWYVSYGIISGDWAGYILMDGTMTHGDSGGPWINMRGEVVGMSDWQLGDEEPESAVKGGVSAKKMKAFLNDHKKPEVSSSETYTVRHSEPTHRRPL
jgi:S1-C subfamily serine protease